MKLELYVGDTCPFCRKVLNFIDENDIEGVEIKNVNQNQEDMDRLINEGGKMQVPCLFVDGKAMYESDDIIEFLDEI